MHQEKVGLQKMLQVAIQASFLEFLSTIISVFAASSLIAYYMYVHRMISFLTSLPVMFWSKR